MDELIFRAFHKERKIMYWFDLMWGNFSRGNGFIGMVEVGKSRDSLHCYNGNQTLVDPDNCEIIRPTGLHDKTREEIYEGDILRIKHDVGNNDLESEKKWYVNSYYKVLNMGYNGITLSFIKVAFENDINCQIPVYQRLEIHNELCVTDGEKLGINETYGENAISGISWIINHRSNDIEIIGNIYQDKHLLNEN